MRGGISPVFNIQQDSRSNNAIAANHRRVRTDEVNIGPAFISNLSPVLDSGSYRNLSIRPVSRPYE